MGFIALYDTDLGGFHLPATNALPTTPDPLNELIPPPQ